MPNKIFSAVPNPNLQAEDWTPRGQIYTLKEIDEIKTGDGGGNIPDPTSIPTPFARIDLFHTAFEQAQIFLINQRQGVPKPQYEPWYNIKVSHALDLAFLLFNFKRFKDKIEIVTWDREKELNALLSSRDPDVNRYGRTLDLFLNADGDTYNFKTLDKIHIVKWINGNAVIGGSSPATLLFTSGNDLQKITKETQIENWPAFENRTHPLHDREYEFQLYLHQLGSTITNSGLGFKAFTNYLSESRKTLASLYPETERRLTEDLRNNTGDLSRDYSTIVSSTGVNFRFCGVELFQSSDSKEPSPKDTSLLIKATKPQERVPILIPNRISDGHRYPGGQVYHNVSFPSEALVISKSEPNYKRRTLPKNGKEWPFIAIDDLLENELFVLDFQPDRHAFFMPHHHPDAQGYLLPLKPTFFEFFSIEDLIQGTQTKRPGLPSIEVNSTGSEANSLWEVILNIPTQVSKGSDPTIASFTRKYGNTTGSASETRGRRVDVYFNSRIFPFVTNAGRYRIGLAAENFGDVPAESWDLTLFDSTKNVNQEISTIKREIRSNLPNSSIYFKVNENFDAIRIFPNPQNFVSGFLIPQFVKPVPNPSDVRFAIDFGTTNTHIEFAVGSQQPEPFSFKVGDGFVGDLMADSVRKTQKNKFRNRQFEREFLPIDLVVGSPFSFPRRSVLCYKLGHLTGYEAYLNANFGFDYNHGYSEQGFELDLKWGSSNQNPQLDSRLNAEFESLSMLIWAKALTLGTSLATSKIIWFHPTSMLRGRLNVLKTKWEDHLISLFKEINGQNIRLISESQAPFSYYMKQQGVLGAGTHVLIDMGGGTTDFLIYSNGKVVYQTSARFAGQHFFGNGINNPPSKNGFLKTFMPNIQKVLDQFYVGGETKTAIEEISKWNDPDVGSYLFSLKTRDQEVNFDLAHELSRFRPELKTIPLLAVLSIAYYTAKLLQNLGIRSVNSLMFSGNSSKILTIVDPDPKYRESILRLVISRIFNSNLNIETTDFKIHTDPHPKTLTAKGGVYFLDPQNIENEVPKPEFTVANRPYSDPDEQGIKVTTLVQEEVTSITNVFKDLQAVLRGALKVSDLEGIFVDPETWNWVLNQLEIKPLVEEILKQKIIDGGDQVCLKEEPWLTCLGGLLGRLASDIVDQKTEA
jgi:hypothetical protein